MLMSASSENQPHASIVEWGSLWPAQKQWIRRAKQHEKQLRSSKSFSAKAKRDSLGGRDPEPHRFQVAERDLSPSNTLSRRSQHMQHSHQETVNSLWEYRQKIQRP